MSEHGDHQRWAGPDVAWYVVRTKPRRETFAQGQLRRRGVTTFLPRVVERRAVGQPPGVGPLFPGYLFAHFSLERQLWQVAYAPGVCYLVGFGADPAPVGADVVHFLRQRCGRDGVLDAAPRFAPGDAVRVRGGAPAGLEGIVHGRLSGRERVEVLLELLRRQTRVSLPVELLEHAGP